jgi:hypothetical protein
MKYPILMLLLSLSFLSLAQKHKRMDTIQLVSEPQEIQIPERVKPEKALQFENDSLQKGLREYVHLMQNEKTISDNVEVSVNAEVVGELEQKAIKVVYSYSIKSDTTKYQTDDFSLGRYTLDASNAMRVTMEIMKRHFEKELSGYIRAGKEITFTIHGCADASPIKNKIPYNNEYGERLSENCIVNNTVEQLLITSDKGITTNLELAFVRSYTVRDYIAKHIPILHQTRNRFIHEAQVSSFRGAEYRRVTIEIIIHNAFENPLTK